MIARTAIEILIHHYRELCGRSEATRISIACQEFKDSALVKYVEMCEHELRDIKAAIEILESSTNQQEGATDDE